MFLWPKTIPSVGSEPIGIGFEFFGVGLGLGVRSFGWDCRTVAPPTKRSTLSSPTRRYTHRWRVNDKIPSTHTHILKIWLCVCFVGPKTHSCCLINNILWVLAFNERQTSICMQIPRTIQAFQAPSNRHVFAHPTCDVSTVVSLFTVNYNWKYNHWM